MDVRHHVPTIGFEAFGRIVGEPAVHVTVDGDAVVIVEADEFAETQRAGQRARLVRDPLHEAAVANKHVAAVIDDVESRAVEFLSQQPFRQRHADRVSEPLTQRPGSGLHARGHAVFGVTRRLGMQLTEAHQLLHRQIVAGEVQQRIQK